jgi:chitinase
MQAFTRVVFLAFCLLGAPASRAEPCYRIVAYAAGWSLPAHIDASRFTHLNFAFGQISEGRIRVDGAAIQHLQMLSLLKHDNPGLKILLSVGGWQAEGFSDAAFDASSRRRFADSAAKIVEKLSLDGLDLDWEYPGSGEAGIKYRSEDASNFELLLRAVRGRLGPTHLLTVALADGKYIATLDLPRLARQLDYINVMTYDFYNSTTPTTGHHAALYAAPGARSADAAIRQYLQAGVRAEQLTLGVPFYGRGFAGASPTDQGIGQHYEHFEAEHSYADIKRTLLGAKGVISGYDQKAEAPFLWNADAHLFITYDNARSIAAKSRYVAREHLGGVMFWELSQDVDGELEQAIAGGLNAMPHTGRCTPPGSAHSSPLEWRD